MSEARTEAITAAKGEVRISTVVGDRLCIRCGFNLCGQTVLREPHYSMLIVRCPECSTVAALQEYPALGPWAARWAAVLAALWMVVLLALLAGCSLGMFGFILLNAETLNERYAAHISLRHQEWARALPDAQARLGSNYQWLFDQEVGAGAWVDGKWWKEQDAAALLAEVGGPIGGLNPRAVWYWPWLGLTGLATGAVWSVVLLGAPRRRAMALACLPIAIAGVISLMMYSAMRSTWLGGAEAVGDIARERLAWVVLPLLLVSLVPTVALGAWIGRPLVRAMVRAFLPPRMMGSLAFLWIAEGMEVPRPGLGGTVRAGR
jgi:hypothetical protein